jgi:hypothetical protein
MKEDQEPGVGGEIANQPSDPHVTATVPKTHVATHLLNENRTKGALDRWGAHGNEESSGSALS